MNKLKLGVIGCGFWSNFQIAAWHELEGVELIAVCDSNLEKARQVAKKFDIQDVYSSADELFESEDLDFVDIISGVNSHFDLIRRSLGKYLKQKFLYALVFRFLRINLIWPKLKN